MIAFFIWCSLCGFVGAACAGSLFVAVLFLILAGVLTHLNVVTHEYAQAVKTANYWQEYGQFYSEKYDGLRLNEPIVTQKLREQVASLEAQVKALKRRLVWRRIYGQKKKAARERGET